MTNRFSYIVFVGMFVIFIFAACGVQNHSYENDDAYGEYLLFPAEFFVFDEPSEQTQGRLVVNLGFVGSSTQPLAEIAQQAFDSLPHLEDSFFIDRRTVDAYELYERLNLHFDDERMLNAFAAPLETLSALPNTDSIYLAAVLGERPYIGLFINRDLASTSIARFVVSRFQKIVAVDNADLLLWDTAHISNALRGVLGLPIYSDAVTRLLGGAERLLQEGFVASTPTVLSVGIYYDFGEEEELVLVSSNATFSTFASTIGGKRVVILTTFLPLQNSGELTTRWYDLDGNLVATGEYLPVSLTQVGDFTFFAHVVNAINGEELVGVSPPIQLTIRGEVEPPYMEFLVFYEPWRVELGIVTERWRSYGDMFVGNHRQYLEDFTRQFILGNPSIRYIRVDGRFNRIRGVGDDGGGIAFERARYVSNFLRELGVDVQIYDTANIEDQEGVEPYRRRVIITVAYE